MFGTPKKYKNNKLDKWYQNLEIKEWVDNSLTKAAMRKKWSV